MSFTQIAPWATSEIIAAVIVGIFVVGIIVHTVRQADRERAAR